MAKTLNAKKLRAALRKAQNVGKVEEAVTIDGCRIVLQNLAPEDYNQILDECDGLNGAEYMHALQIGHICRSVVELEGVDLRDVKYVEDDVPTGEWVLTATFRSESTGKRAIALLKEANIQATLVAPSDEAQQNMERHEWVRLQMAGWGREAVHVAWRKFADVISASENRAQAGIQFNRETESLEDKYRRLLREAKELEGELPPDLAQKVADDMGFLLKSSEAEREAAAERVREFHRQQQEQSAVEAEQDTEPEQEPEPRVPTPPQPQLDPALLMKNRQPLNRQPVNPPVPMPASEQVLPAVGPTRVPEQIRAAAVNMQQRTSERVAQIAALEAESLMDVPASPVPGRPVAELSQQTPPINPAAVLGIIEQPPSGGLNPRYNPPRRP